MQLPKCLLLGLVYGQCCTALPCIAATGTEGLCEIMYSVANQILPGLLAGVMPPPAPAPARSKVAISSLPSDYIEITSEA